ATTENSADGYHDDVHQQMPSVLLVTRIRQRFEIGPNRFDLDPLLCHSTPPCTIRSRRGTPATWSRRTCMPLDLWCTIAQVGAPDLLAYLFLRAGRVSTINRHVPSRSCPKRLSRFSRKSSSVRVSRSIGARIFPVGTWKFPNSPIVPWRVYSNSCFATEPGLGSRSGAIRESAWTPVCSSMHTV